MMKKSTNDQLVKVVIFFVGLTGLLSLIINHVFPKNSFVFGFFVIFSMFMLYFGRDYVFKKIIYKIPVVSSQNPLFAGEWSVIIEFLLDGRPQKRTGQIKVSPSLHGLQINGSSLINDETKIITENGWYSEHGELIVYDGHQILYYIYKIPVSKNDPKAKKVGFVYAARRISSGATTAFSGFFRDIKVIDGKEELREGSITLAQATFD